MNRYIHVVYCDDLRPEIGNKTSFMGVYQQKMIVSQLPAVLSKLCIFITIGTPVEEPFKSLRVFVKKDDEVIAESSLSEEILCTAQQDVSQAIERDHNDDEDLQGRFSVSTCLVFEGFGIDAPCRIKVRAIADGEELRGNTLKIEVSNPLLPE